MSGSSASTTLRGLSLRRPAAGTWSASSGTWSLRHPPPDNITPATRAAVHRALGNAAMHRLSMSARTADARVLPERAGDSVLSYLQISMIERDSAGTWQDPQNWDPAAFSIICTACSPSKSKNVLYFKSLDAWRLHAQRCPHKGKRIVHGPADDCFRQSLSGDRVRAGLWYCSQCHPRTQEAQLFGRTLETQMARRMHYIQVHDVGAVIALEDCSEEFRKHIQACRQTKHDSAIYCDTDSDAEEQMAQAWWWSGAAQPAQSAADGIGKKPIVARHCDSRRRTHGVTNCSMTEAARRKARKEYASEA